MLLKIIFVFFFTFLSFSGFSKDFDDMEFNLLLREDKCGVIYTNSKRMPLSEVGYYSVEKFTDQFNLDFIPVKDPYSIYPGDPFILKSEKLIKLGVANHFPSYVIYSGITGKIFIIQGYESYNGLAMLTKKFLNEEKCNEKW